MLHCGPLQPSAGGRWGEPYIFGDIWSINSRMSSMQLITRTGLIWLSGRICMSDLNPTQGQPTIY